MHPTQEVAAGVKDQQAHAKKVEEALGLDNALTVVTTHEAVLEAGLEGEGFLRGTIQWEQAKYAREGEAIARLEKRAQKLRDTLANREAFKSLELSMDLFKKVVERMLAHVSSERLWPWVAPAAVEGPSEEKVSAPCPGMWIRVCVGGVVGIRDTWVAFCYCPAPRVHA